MSDENYAHSEISAAVNAGANVVQNELPVGERDHDLINLVVNAAMTCLDNPEASFDEVVRSNYDYHPDEVRGWWSA